MRFALAVASAFVLCASASAAVSDTTGPQVAFTPRIWNVTLGGSTVVTGTATGGTGPVTLWGRARDSFRSFRVGSVVPVDGTFRFSVSPRVTTRYEATYDGVHASRLVYVTARYRVQISHGTLTIAVRPVPALAHEPVHLVVLRSLRWQPLFQARTNLAGVAVFRHVAPGRYYAYMDGGGLYGGFTTPKFAVHG